METFKLRKNFSGVLAEKSDLSGTIDCVILAKNKGRVEASKLLLCLYSEELGTILAERSTDQLDLKQYLVDDVKNVVQLMTHGRVQIKKRVVKRFKKVLEDLKIDVDLDKVEKTPKKEPKKVNAIKKTPNSIEVTFKDHSIKVELEALQDGRARCLKCSKTLSNRRSGIRHLFYVHFIDRSSPSFECNICFKKFVSKEYVNSHMIKAHGIHKKTTQKIAIPNSLEDHMKDNSSKKKLTKTLSKPVKVHSTVDEGNQPTKVELKTLKDGRKKCLECGKILSAKNARRHYLDFHLTDRSSLASIKCELCPAEFASKNYLSKHIKRVHGYKEGDENLKSLENGHVLCIKCGKEFKIKGYGRLHYKQKHATKEESGNLKSLEDAVNNNGALDYESSSLVTTDENTAAVDSSSNSFSMQGSEILNDDHSSNSFGINESVVVNSRPKQNPKIEPKLQNKNILVNQSSKTLTKSKEMVGHNSPKQKVQKEPRKKIVKEIGYPNKSPKTTQALQKKNSKLTNPKRSQLDILNAPFDDTESDDDEDSI